ncbi:MAG: tyrosine-type recombinase/integrase [Erysipelotrichaceae bacterium]|nr:tyrosine-type recombinase/integrase [Erysipelotrichaceae bacterium]
MSTSSEIEKQSILTAKSDEIIATLPNCAKMFFRNLRNENKSERTICQYAYDIRGFFDYLSTTSGFKNKNLNSLKIEQILDKLNKEDLQEYVESLNTYTYKNEYGRTTNKKSSPNYIARKVSSLKSFYKYYQDCGDIKTNPSILIKNPKIKHKNIMIMESDEVKRIMDAVNDESNLTPREKSAHAKSIKRDTAIMMLLLGTGIRVSELVGIDIKDIDFKEASIKVVRKGGDEDEVFFSTDVENALHDYIDNERPQTSDPALFISSYKTRISDRAVEKLIKNYADKAGLNKKITPHALRRTFGTTLYESTGDIYLTANALHHKSVDTTRTHYVRKNRELTRDAVTKLDIFNKK